MNILSDYIKEKEGKKEKKRRKKRQMQNIILLQWRTLIFQKEN